MLSLCAFAQKPYSPPKLADGTPDLQGYWTNISLTPFERPASLGNKEFFTAEEAAKFAADNVANNNADRRDGGARADLGRAYNDFWYNRGTAVGKTLRTSIVIDPKDGRVPALTPAAQKAAQDRAAYGRAHPDDGPEDFFPPTRCLVWPTLGPPMLPSFYNNNYQIVQSPGTVAILVEMIHDVRLIPTDNRPHLAMGLAQWAGDPRGHWEGNTLVVETTNFTSKNNFRGSGPNMKLTEKFTRTDSDTLLYEFTVNDPESFTRPWTGQVPMVKMDGPLYEYACHEGNYAMEGMLAGARKDEKK